MRRRQHFGPGCSSILALGGMGTIQLLVLPRKLGSMPGSVTPVPPSERKFHPDYYYNAPPRSGSPPRALVFLRRLPRAPHRRGSRTAGESRAADRRRKTYCKVPPTLLEEVFALNEYLDEIRDLRESGYEHTLARV